MPLAPGSKLGPYEILAPLGAGGMGEVYRAKDTRLGRDVAVKVLPEHLSASPEVRARFEREAKSISSLNHPHICTLFDIGREGDTDFLVMELVEGETLAARLERGALPTSEVLRLGAQIADALDRAHRAGIVHRDLKPANVMLTKSGAKLMDFGLARATGVMGSGSGTSVTLAALSQSPTVSRPLTAEGTIVGTFQYMSPEQLEGGESDARSDLWALGCVLYEMATGRRAFQGKSQASLISSIMKDEPPPVTQIAPMNPPALERLVQACLAKESAERIQSAHDVKLQLSWIAEGASQAGAAAPGAALASTARRSGRERLAWALAAVGLVAAVALFFALVSRPNEPELIHASIAPAAGTALTGFWSSIMLSPDGRTVAFFAIDSTGGGIWTRPLESATPTQIPDTRDLAFYLFWSHDGRSIAYFTYDGKLKKVAIDGGSPVTLCSAPGGRGGTWNRDGVIVFAPAPEGPLMRVSSGGGEATPVTTLDTARHETSHRFPNFLPDGDHFLFVSLPSGPNGWDTCVGSLKSKSVKKVVTAGSAAVFAESGHLVFERDGRVMAQGFDARRLELVGDAVVIGNAPEPTELDAEPVASVSRNGRMAILQSEARHTQLRWLDRAGAERGVIPLPLASWSVRGLSPDERRAAVMNGTDIWIVDLERAMPTRFAATLSNEPSLAWSPDGTRMAFVSKKTGKLEIYVGNSSGAGEPEMLVTNDALFKAVHGWSPDGRLLVFGALDAATGWDLWLLPMEGDRKPVPFATGAFYEGFARVSPDGRWLAYESDESGAREIYIQSFPAPGKKVRVSRDGGRAPAWSRAGEELIYRRGAAVMAVPIVGDADLRLGEPQPLFTLPDGVTGGSVSADGDRFLVSVADDVRRRDIRLVLDWAAAIAR
ncbi:MAG: protein kinase domain-containing protein [bacterium]